MELYRTSGEKKRIDFFLLYILSFALPVLLFMIVLRKGGFYPFGEKTLLIYDMNDQVMEFMASIRYLHGGDDSIFYSWSHSMGGNYLGLYAYYLGSPLTYITALFPIGKMPAAICLLTGTKIGLAGLSFALLSVYLLKKVLPGRDMRTLTALPLCIAYAFLSYNFEYAMMPMWMDGVIFLPLIILGVEKLLDGERGAVYLISLTALFYFNYYTGYMVGLFAGLYFLCRLFVSAERGNLRLQAGRIVRFTVLSVLSVGIAAPLLWAVLKDLSNGRLNGGAKWTGGVAMYESFAEFWRVMCNRDGEIPSLYVGYFPLLLACIFFFLPRGRIRIREKLAALFLNLVFGISFYFSAPYLLWHGMQVPNEFPYRFAFLYSFVLLGMGLRVVIAWCGKMRKKKEKELQSVLTALRKWGSTVLLAGILCLEMPDLAQNAGTIMERLDRQLGYKNIGEYTAFIETAKPLTDYLKDNDSGLYRVSQLLEYSKNDALLLGYHGMTHYSSTYNQKINDVTRKLGLAQVWLWNSGYGSNRLLDSLWGVRYVLTDGIIEDGYRIMKSSIGADLYGNDTALEMLYSAEIRDADPDLESPDPYVNLNRFLNAVAGKEGEQERFLQELPYSLELREEEAVITFTADSQNPVYFFIPDNGSSEAQIYVNDVYMGNCFTHETLCSHYLGNFAKGEAVSVRLYVGKGSDLIIPALYLAELDMEKSADLLERLAENEIRLDDHKAGKLSGEIYVPEGCAILTAIPYDEGWSIYLDGKKVDPRRFANAFLLIDAEEGEHRIELKYLSPGIRDGLWITVVSAVLAVFFFGMQFKAGRAVPQAQQNSGSLPQ